MHRNPPIRQAAGNRCWAADLALLVTLLLAAAPGWAELPWREAGLSERQAAAHLLNRFTYGPRPGEIEAMVELGLDNWLDWQLQGELPGALADAALARFGSLNLTFRELTRNYPHHNMLLAQAVAAGAVSEKAYTGQLGEDPRRRSQRALERFAKSRGLRPEREVLAELRAQKLYRALYSESQLTEVLTDFWFNHFNVSAADSKCRPYVLAYERDAIRPHVLGSFRTLLGATARHPAMLIYLDNAYSEASPRAKTTFELEMEDLGEFSPTENPTFRQRLAKTLRWRPPGMVDEQAERRGLNENYARELLELHTLGVDGGYRQRDVIEVARAFTGWGRLPKSESQRKMFTQAAAETDFGFVVDGEFLFRADRHDAGPKTILGVPFPAGRGVEDGEEVLDLLAQELATVRHLSRKIAVRFVSDRPSDKLTARLVRAWKLTGGDLRQVILALAESPEFWLEAREPGKLKSPLELVASALRALDADLQDPMESLRWIATAGQPLYTCAPPTGYPDRPETWASAGALLNRVNFGRALSRGGVRGAAIDFLGLVGDRGLDSTAEAMRAYLPLVLAERRLGELLESLAAEEGPGNRDQSAVRATDSAEPADPDRLRRAEMFAKYALGVLLATPEFQYR